MDVNQSQVSSTWLLCLFSATLCKASNQEYRIAKSFLKILCTGYGYQHLFLPTWACFARTNLRGSMTFWILFTGFRRNWYNRNESLNIPRSFHLKRDVNINKIVGNDCISAADFSFSGNPRCRWTKMTAFRLIEAPESGLRGSNPGSASQFDCNLVTIGYR